MRKRPGRLMAPRRGGGGAITLPSGSPFSFTPLAYYDETSIVQSGGAASQWTDLTGGGLDFAQAVGGNQPAYSAAGWSGGTPCLSFDGTTDRMQTAYQNWAAKTVLCTFLALQMPTPGTMGQALTLIDQNSNDYETPGARLLDDGGSAVKIRRGVDSSPSSVDTTLAVAFDTPIYLGSIIKTDGTIRIRNLGAGTTASVSGVTPATMPGAGALLIGSGWGHDWGYYGACPMLVRRLLVTDFEPDATQRTEILAWLD